MDRRRALITLGLSSLSAPLLAGCAREEEHHAASEEELQEDDGMVELLFVQEAGGVQFEDGKLTMVNVNPNILYFADRPDRVAGYWTAEEFMTQVSTGPDSFAEDPPNATLVSLLGDEFATLVLVLAERPQYADGNLIFPSVQIIEGEAPSSGGPAALFIDTVGHPASPGSVAGAHRRHRRREKRRHRR